MRKVTEKIAQAFHNGQKLTLGNTYTNGQAVFLFDNQIIRRCQDGTVWFNLCGWNTVTTRERINGILADNYLNGISQRKGTPYYMGKPIDDNTWYQHENLQLLSQTDQSEVA